MKASAKMCESLLYILTFAIERYQSENCIPWPWTSESWHKNAQNNFYRLGHLPTNDNISKVTPNDFNSLLQSKKIRNISILETVRAGANMWNYFKFLMFKIATF